MFVVVLQVVTLIAVLQDLLQALAVLVVAPETPVVPLEVVHHDQEALGENRNQGKWISKEISIKIYKYLMAC